MINKRAIYLTTLLLALLTNGCQSSSDSTSPDITNGLSASDFGSGGDIGGLDGMPVGAISLDGMDMETDTNSDMNMDMDTNTDTSTETASDTDTSTDLDSSSNADNNDNGDNNQDGENTSSDSDDGDDSNSNSDDSDDGDNSNSNSDDSDDGDNSNSNSNDGDDSRNEGSSKSDNDAKSYSGQDDDDDDDDSNSTDDMDLVNMRFVPMGDINASLNGKNYQLKSLKDLQNGLQSSGFDQYDVYEGGYAVQIAGYDLQGANVNVETGSVMFRFAMPALGEAGSYKLIYPKNSSGDVVITSTQQQNDNFLVSGYIDNAQVYTEDGSSTFGLSGSFNVLLIPLRR